MSTTANVYVHFSSKHVINGWVVGLGIKMRPFRAQSPSRLNFHSCTNSKFCSIFVERKVHYSALFTSLVGWHANAVSLPPSDIPLAQLACLLSDIVFWLHSGIVNLHLYKHWFSLIYLLYSTLCTKSSYSSKFWNLFYHVSNHFIWELIILPSSEIANTK